jgi:hypothetical protein
MHTSIAIWLYEVDADRPKQAWPFGHFDLVGLSSKTIDAATIDAIEGLTRGGFIHKAFVDTKIFALLDRLTAVKGGEVQKRVFDALNTLHFEFIPHPTKPIVIGYLKSLTPNIADEQHNTLLHGLDVYPGKYGYVHRSKQGLLAECMVCKSAAHPSFRVHGL